MQLDLFTAPVQPGLFEVRTPYRNEMGHTFKVGELVSVDAVPAPHYAVCSWPDDTHGQRFHLSTSTLTAYWRPWQPKRSP